MVATLPFLSCLRVFCHFLRQFDVFRLGDMDGHDLQARSVRFECDARRVAVGEFAAQDDLRERLADLAVNEAVERARSPFRLVAMLGEPVPSFGVDDEGDVPIRRRRRVVQGPLHLFEAEIDNLGDTLWRERVEHDLFVEAVELYMTTVFSVWGTS